MLKMSDAELRRNLRLHGLYGPEEQRHEEQREAEKRAGGRSARSVSMSDEPERKKQKKEKAEPKKKEEEAKKKKEAEDLRPNSNPNRMSSCMVTSLMRRLDARLRRAHEAG